MTEERHDPKGLIRESYRIDGITAAECRSIFLDWVLGVPEDADTRCLIKAHLEHYRPLHPNHPMTEVLRQGLVGPSNPARRGGWRARRRN